MTTEKNLVRVGVASWIWNPYGEVLLGWRMGAHGAGTWSPPGGHMEFGESPTEAAIRETAEETGLILPSTDVHVVGITNDIFNSENRHYVTIHCITQLEMYVNPKVVEPDRCAEWRWVAPNALPGKLFLPAAKFMRYVIAKLR